MADVRRHHQEVMKVYALEHEQKEMLSDAFFLMDFTGTGEISRADLEEAVTKKRGGNFFAKMV